MLVGNDVELRPLKDGDDKMLFKWRNDLQYVKFTKSIRFPKHSGLELEWLQQMMKDKSNRNIIFIITSNPDSHPIGLIQLTEVDWISKNCMFGIAISETEFRGKGLAKESMKLLFDYAFNILNLHKISLEVIDGNDNSIGLYEQFGFDKEGCRKEQYFWNSQYHDVFIYGLLKSKFLESKGQ